MASADPYLRDKTINDLLRVGTKYLSLYTTTTLGGGGTEVVGGSYARQTITLAVPVAGSGATSNTNEIIFSNVPDLTTNPVVGWGIHDHVSAGNRWLRDDFPSPLPYAVGSSIRIIIGALDIVVL